MKKWKGIGVALVLGAGIVGSIPLITNAASETPQDQNAAGFGAAIGRTAGPMIDSVSKMIGLTTDEIQTERQAGKSLTEIAKEKGITEEKLLQDMLKTRQTQLDALVKDGTLTKEQADQYLTQMKERMKVMIERTETGRPDFAPQRGQGQGQGMQRGNCTGTMGQQNMQGSGAANL